MTSHSNLNMVARDDDSTDNEEDHPQDELYSFTGMKEETRSLASHGTYEKKESIVHRISAPKRSARKAPPTEPNSKFSIFPLSSTSSLHLSEISSLIYDRSNTLEDDGSPQFLFGVPASDLRLESGTLFANPSTSRASNRIVHDHQQQFPPSRLPPGFDNTTSGSRTQSSTESEFSTTLGRRTHTSNSRGVFDDATEENHSGVVFRSDPRVPETSIPTPLLPANRETVDINDLIGSVISQTAKTAISSLTSVESRQRQGINKVSSNLSTSDIGSIRDVFGEANAFNPRSGNPRSILNERYQKQYNRSFTKQDFVTIRDSSDGDHIPTFTSIFVCPASGECFLSGDLLSVDFATHRAGNFVLKRDRMNWYKKKATAEFAAAGRAEDCFRLRSGECGSSGPVEQFCAESPKRSKEEEQRDISAFLESRACDANARDKCKYLSKKL